MEVLRFLGTKAAWPGMWNLALLVYPVQRTLGPAISHREIIFLHVWAGKATFFWFVFHALLLSLYYAATFGWSRWSMSMMPHRDLYTEGIVNFMGWISLLALCILLATSHPYFRSRFYETFERFHLLCSLLFLLFANLHDYNTLHFVQPAIAAWIADRLLRRFSGLKTCVCIHPQDEPGHPSNTAKELVVSTPVDMSNARLVNLKLSIPETWCCKTLQPGSFIYLKDTSISCIQSHPFSIGAVDPCCRTVSINIKDLGDWTKHFVDKVEQSMALNLPTSTTAVSTIPTLATIPNVGLEIEGPYSTDLFASCQKYRNCLFVAGGIGMTGLSEVIYKRHCSCQPQTVVWIARTVEEMEFLVPLLNRLESRTPLNDAAATTKIKLFISQQQNMPQRFGPSPDLPQQRRKSMSLLSSQSSLSSTVFTKEITVFASLAGVALSFLVSRLIACTETWTVTEAASGVFTAMNCTLFDSSVSCVRCETQRSTEMMYYNESSSASLPCCTIEKCYLAFRGIPMVMTLILTPAFTYSFVVAMFHLSSWWRRFFVSMLPYIPGRRYMALLSSSLGSSNTLAIDEPMEAIEATVPVGITKECQFGSDFEEDNTEETVTILDRLVVFRRPSLSEILGDFCLSCSEILRHATLGRDQYTASVAAVVACGSQGLVDSVRLETEKQRARLLSGAEDDGELIESQLPVFLTCQNQ